MEPTTFRAGCDLDYDVSGPSAFFFNVGGVSNSFNQRSLLNDLTLSIVFCYPEATSRSVRSTFTACFFGATMLPGSMRRFRRGV